MKQANKGEYLRAIKMFQQVLSDLPEHGDARRKLGMAYLEPGDKQRAWFVNIAKNAVKVWAESRNRTLLLTP